MTDAPEYATLSPAARAYLEAHARYLMQELGYLSAATDAEHELLRGQVLEHGAARDAACWQLSEQEREDVARAQSAHIRRLTQALQESA